MVAHGLDDGGRGELRRCNRGGSYYGGVRRSRNLSQESVMSSVRGMGWGAPEGGPAMEELSPAGLLMDLAGGAAGLEMRSGLGRRRPAFRGGDGD